MPREILQITPEATQGVFNSAGAHTIIDLPADDSFTLRPAPNFFDIPSAASDNLITYTGSATENLSGKLQVYVRPGQAAVLAAAIAGVTGSVCKTLPTYTIDHAIFIEDGSCTPVYRRYLGCMFDGGFSLDNSAQGCLMMFSMDVKALSPATITGTDFPTPAFGSYDYAERPFTFEDSFGAITLGGADISQFVESLSYSAGNIITQFRGGGKFYTANHYGGRRPTITMRLLYYSAQERIDFEAITAKSLNIVFTNNVHTLTLAFGNKNYYRTVTDNTKLGDFHRQTVMLQNIMDPATGTDMTITYAA